MTLKTMNDVATAMRDRKIRTFAQQGDAINNRETLTQDERDARAIYLAYIVRTPGERLKPLP